MNQKKLIETFMIFQVEKNPLIFTIYAKIFQRLKGFNVVLLILFSFSYS